MNRLLLATEPGVRDSQGGTQSRIVGVCLDLLVENASGRVEVGSRQGGVIRLAVDEGIKLRSRHHTKLVGNDDLWRVGSEQRERLVVAPIEDVH